jgi:hypothetical protein
LNENKDGDRNSSRKCQSLQEPIRVILESNWCLCSNISKSIFEFHIRESNRQIYWTVFSFTLTLCLVFCYKTDKSSYQPGSREKIQAMKGPQRIWWKTDQYTTQEIVWFN